MIDRYLRFSIFLFIFIYSLSSCNDEQVDTTSPQIVSIYPSNGERDIPVNTDITIVFSEALNPNSVAPSSFSLRDGGDIRDGTINLSDGTVTYSPTIDLRYGSVYIFTVFNSIIDLSGNRIDEMEITFQTEAPPDPPPNVDKVDPYNEQSNVSISTNIYIKMFKDIDGNTVNSSTVKLLKYATLEDVLITLAYADSVITADPVSDLENSTKYQVVITTGIQDLNGLPLISEVKTTFTTEN